MYIYKKEINNMFKKTYVTCEKKIIQKAFKILLQIYRK